MVIAVIVPFLDEEEFLPGFVESIAAQTRAPDHLLLVDDGSRDRSPELAREFAARHAYVRTLHRPVRPPARDRLATASEWDAWQWGVAQLGSEADLLVKLDADLILAPRLFEEMERLFTSDPELGLAGTHLRERGTDGRLRRERNREDHIRGATKFYRAECYRQISPVEPILGWDTADEVAARMHGWRTLSVEIPGGETIHQRPTGTYNGRLRGYWRRGRAAYGYGAHPLYVLAGGIRRLAQPPYFLSGLSYLAGWLSAWATRAPRSRAPVRRQARNEQLAKLRALLPARLPR